MVPEKTPDEALIRPQRNCKHRPDMARTSDWKLVEIFRAVPEMLERSRTQ
jgi:hypothetical protein